jgi:hypothetical protein
MRTASSVHQQHERDRAVRRSGQLRAALIGTSALASLGIAGALGLSALNGQTSTAATTPTSTNGQGTSSRLQPGLSNSGSLSSGTGSSHATTQGS